MNRTHPIDEFTLASFLAGTLPHARRREVITYLAENEDARELLKMAYEAMEVAGATPAPLEEPLPAPAASPSAPGPAPRQADRAPTHRPAEKPARAPRRRLRTLGRLAAAAVVVFSIGLGLRLTFGPAQDTLRSAPGTTTQGEAFTVELSEAGLRASWTPVPQADRYRLVVFDPAEARVVRRHETDATTLATDAAFSAELREALTPGRTYTLRVDAIDAQQRTLLRSDAVEFKLSE